jgi:hypothetical protein
MCRRFFNVYESVYLFYYYFLRVREKMINLRSAPEFLGATHSTSTADVQV